MAAGTAVLLILFVLHVGVGSLAISPWGVVLTLTGHAPAPYESIIIDDIRLPRSMIAPVAGAMLGIAGALIQSLTRNPLTDPSLTGVSSGVSSGAILAIVSCLAFVPGAVNEPALLPFAALAGGLAAVAILYILTSGLRDGPFVLVLKGVVTGAILSSASSLILVQNNDKLPTVLLWLTGSLDAKTWTDWATLWPWAVAAIPAGLACARAGNALELGDDTAIGLGYRVRTARATLFAVAAVLTAAAVAVVGAIGFVGLIGPHIARLLAGHDNRRVYPLSALVTANLVLLADLLTQVAALIGPGIASAIPVGAVTALFGAPFFLYLLARTSSQNM
jgi:iron complex transport system permease protein